MGKSHSLTLSRLTSVGSRLIASSAQELLQPQSQTISRVRLPDCTIPSKILELTSAITSAADRFLQRGQFAPPPCDQQFVRFSDAVIVKNASRSGTARQMLATERVRYARTSS